MIVVSRQGACAPAPSLPSYERVLAYHPRCVAGCNYIAFREFIYFTNFNLIYYGCKLFNQNHQLYP